MAEWELISEDKAAQTWDAMLSRFPDASPFQSFGWGQYYRDLGWQPLYLAAGASGESTSLFLGLTRRYPLGVGLVWAPGGPVGDPCDWDDSLFDAVERYSKLNRVYLRFRCDRARSATDTLYLLHAGWHRTIQPLTSGVSMSLDLTRPLTELEKSFDGNWRRNLKLGYRTKAVLRRVTDPDIDRIHKAFVEMERRKDLPEQFSHERLTSIFNRMARDLIYYECEDEDGQLLGFRGCLRAGDRAVDFLAATTEAGRKARISYRILSEFLMDCRELGVRSYDLGGIDPWENPGVYKFKSGTGAAEIEYLGEWDRASSGWLRLAGNWAIGRKNRSRQPDKRASTRPSATSQAPETEVSARNGTETEIADKGRSQIAITASAGPSVGGDRAQTV
jgi:hypothetical protein